VAELNR
jgi:hypothetical protein